jgi:hypothetical protein
VRGRRVVSSINVIIADYGSFKRNIVKKRWYCNEDLMPLFLDENLYLYWIESEKSVYFIFLSLPIGHCMLSSNTTHL